MARRTGGMSAATRASFRAAAKRVQAAGKQLSQEFGHGLYLIGQEVMTDVKDAKPGKGVPVDEGTLRSTGDVLRIGNLGGEHQAVELVFGGAGAEYALIQHEELSYHHTIGEARYLVRGLERWSRTRSGAWADMERRVQARLDRAARRGGK